MVKIYFGTVNLGQVGFCTVCGPARILLKRNIVKTLPYQTRNKCDFIKVVPFNVSACAKLFKD